MQSKRGQISSQVFIYIMAAVIMGVIVLIGYNAIATILKNIDAQKYEMFKSDFERNVGIVAPNYEQTKKISLGIPKGYDQICMVTSADEKGNYNFDTSAITMASINRKIAQDGVRENVFMLKKGSVVDQFEIKELGVVDNFICLKNDGRNIVWLKGDGKRAYLFTE